MSNNLFQELYGGGFDESQRTELPVGGEFAQNGFIGPISMKMLSRIWTAVDVRGPEFREEAPQPNGVHQLGNGDYHFYYEKPADASRALKVIGETDSWPQQYWVFSIPTDEIMNSNNLDALRDGFGAEVVYRCSVRTYRARKFLHEFHLITLPSVIAAFATASGFDNAGFDLSEISVNQLSVTDAWSEEYIGSPDAGNWLESTLGQRRAELWKSLGENNPLAYVIDSDRQAKFNIGDNNLKKAMSIVYYPPKKPIMGRLVNVLDPRVDAEYQNSSGEYKRLQLPTVTEFFVDNAAAEAAAKADLDAIAERTNDRNGGDSTSSAPAVNSGPPIPEDWKDMSDDWEAMIIEYVGKPDRALEKAVEEKPGMFACSKDEALAWKHHLES